MLERKTWPWTYQRLYFVAQRVTFIQTSEAIADSSKNCLVIHLLQDFFAIELRRNKMSWCGEVREGKSLIRRLSFSRSFMHTPLWSFLTGTHQSDVDLHRSTFSERLFAWFVSSTKSDKVSFFKVDWGSSRRANFFFFWGGGRGVNKVHYGLCEIG